MPSRFLPRRLAPLLAAFVAAGCANGPGAPAIGPSPIAGAGPVAIAQASPSAAPSAPMLTGRAVFVGPAPADLRVEAFVLGQPGRVIGAGGRTGALRFHLAEAGGAVDFALPWPDALAHGGVLKILVTGGGQTLVGLTSVPAERRVAADGAAMTVSTATTLAYLMLSPRLEGAGQALTASKGDLLQSLVTLVTTVYASLSIEVQASLDQAPDEARLAVLTRAINTALATPEAQPLSATSVDALLSIAPHLGQAFTDAVSQLNAGIVDAVAGGAPKPDTVFLGPLTLGATTAASVRVPGATSHGHGAPAPAHGTTTVEIRPGDLTQPSSGPVVTAD